MAILPPLRDKHAAIINRIQTSAESVGRNPNEIKLVAVTKGFAIGIWQQALKESLTCVGESRVLETEIKSQQFPFRDRIELHLIGHLQSNKARKAVHLFDVIQTVDSIKLAKRINSISIEKNKRQRIFIQVNTGNDPQKQGFSIQDVEAGIKTISKLENLIIEGIMTIPPKGLGKNDIRNIYAETRKIHDNIKRNITATCKYLSMGMSNDFEIAITEGATHIRVGTALFGERPI